MDIVYQLKNVLLANPQQSLAYSVFGYLAYKVSSNIISVIQRKKVHNKLLEKAKLVKSQRDERIKKFVSENKNPDDLHKKIINSSIMTLKNLLKNNEVTSRQMVISFANQCAEVGLEYNLMADADFENALVEAEEADLFMKNNDYEKWPPLCGIPLSIKDSIFIKGMLSTGGFIARSDKPQERDAYLVKVLKKLGAILFVKSNVPQGLMVAESDNYIYGNALNPWNKNKTVGGSSGGEGGLIASRCSPGGFGSDIGGSIRIPASFCGVYAIKPSSRRISRDGHSTLSGDDFSGFKEIRASIGPLGRSLDDVVFLCQQLFGKFDQDDEINNIPFNYEVFNSKNKLKIGYINTTEFCELSTSTITAIEDCKEKLKKNGHTLVPFPVTRLNELFYNMLDIFYGGQVMQDVKKGLKGENLVEAYNEADLLSKLPRWLLMTIKNFYYYLGIQRDYTTLSKLTFPQTSKEYIEVCKSHDILKHEIKTIWREENFDALICPATCFPAYNVGASKYGMNFAKNTFYFNSLDMPGGVVPVGLVTDNTVKPVINDKHFRGILPSVTDSLGMPVTIQVVAMTNNDEMSLRVMKEIDEIYQFEKKYGDKVFDRIQKK